MPRNHRGRERGGGHASLFTWDPPRWTGHEYCRIRPQIPACRKPQVVRFSTIHSFKGLESPVVIVADIDEVDEGDPQSLLYVAMSRARSLLILMVRERAKRSIETRIRAAMKQKLH